MKSWYVVYTKPRWEKKIAALLAADGLEAYCPLNRTRRRWSDRYKLVKEPLFRSYVFVRVSDEDLYKPLKIKGVINYVHWMKKPARVRDSEIDQIRRFLSEHHDVRVQPDAIHVDDPVVIRQGPFMDRRGKVLEVNDNHVKVSIRSLGYSLVASLGRTAVRKTLEPA